MSARVALGMVLGLLALSLAGPARAYDRKAAKAYDEGLAAAGAGDWAEARKAFEQALALDDGEGRIRVSGVKFAEYYPSLGLAEAALELGDAEAARAALKRFDAIKKPGDSQVAKASSLRGRLEAEVPSAPARPAAPTGPAPEAVAARRALDDGDLAGARRLARSAPTDSQAQEVLAAVDALLADKLTSARRDQEAGALGAAESKLQDVLQADPGNSAAKSLLAAVRDDAAGAQGSLSDARAALAARRFEEAEELARKARTRDSSLAGEAKALEQRISQDRRAAGSSPSRPAPAAGAGGRQFLAEARSELDAGRLAQARRKASDALAADAGLKVEVEAVRSEVSSRSRKADEALRSSRSAVGGGRFAEARRLAAQAGRLDQAMAGEVADILKSAEEGEARAQRLVLKIEAHLESGSSANARAAVAELADSFPEHPELAGLRAGVEGSGELVAGMKAYFRGDLATSIDSLSPLVAANAGRSDLLSVLACAHASRGLLLGSEDAGGQEDLARAGELFRQALAANPGLSLDARYFSPRLRALLDQERGD